MVCEISPFPPACLQRANYSRPQVRVGLLAQAGLKTLKPESQVGAQVESNAEGISPGPCAGHPGALKVKKVKLQPNPPRIPEPGSSAERNWGNLPSQAAEAKVANTGVHPGIFFGKVQPIICCFEALQLSLRGV